MLGCGDNGGVITVSSEAAAFPPSPGCPRASQRICVRNGGAHHPRAEANFPRAALAPPPRAEHHVFLRWSRAPGQLPGALCDSPKREAA